MQGAWLKVQSGKWYKVYKVKAYFFLLSLQSYFQKQLYV